MNSISPKPQGGMAAEEPLVGGSVGTKPLLDDEWHVEVSKVAGFSKRRLIVLSLEEQVKKKKKKKKGGGG